MLRVARGGRQCDTAIVRGGERRGVEDNTRREEERTRREEETRRK